jgi:hypothetical protein
MKAWVPEQARNKRREIHEAKARTIYLAGLFNHCPGLCPRVLRGRHVQTAATAQRKGRHSAIMFFTAQTGFFHTAQQPHRKKTFDNPLLRAAFSTARAAQQRPHREKKTFDNHVFSSLREVFSTTRTAQQQSHRERIGTMKPFGDTASSENQRDEKTEDRQ